jgi:hypothetical protein
MRHGADTADPTSHPIPGRTFNGETATAFAGKCKERAYLGMAQV